MSEESKHMDDAFKKASEGMKMPYDASFWDAAKAKLDDATLDDAFRAAAGTAFTAPELESTENVDDLFMDAAFVDASAETEVTYDASYFEQFKASEANTMMDEAFQTAAAATVVDYLPKYWSAADKALIAEGLHYEYNSAYWNDAKKLLDRSDRKVFFAKWSAIAAVLLLISFSGSLIGINNFAGNKQFKEFADNGTANKFGVQSNTASNGGDNNLAQTSIEDQNINLINQQENIVNGAENVSDPSNLVSNLNNAQNGSTTTGLVNLNSSVNSTSNQSGNLLTGLNQKSPVISVASPELSPRDYQIDEREYINKLPVADYDTRDLSVAVPINKGEYKPKMMHSIALLGQIGVGNRWGTTQLLPSLRSGIGVDYTLSGTGAFRNFELNTNFMLNHVRQNNLGFEDRSTEYTNQGGFHNYWRKIQYKDTWMANLNANVNIRLAPRHKVRLGGGIEYLVGVRSNMSFRDSKVSEIEIVNNNWGVKEGITKLDFKLSVGYDFQLTNSIALQLTGNYGFRDRTDDNYLKSPVKFDREMNVMVGVKYTLFRKL
ncbi:MAG: hypothetical protein ABJG68_03775 [Crocinitomicaceae bacterium]